MNLDLPPYQSFPVLTSERVLLRELEAGELSKMLEIMTYDGKTAKNLDEAEVARLNIEKNYLEGNGINWVIQDRSSGSLVGFVGYYRGFENGIGEIGFVLRPIFRGKGFMSEAIQLVTLFGLEIMKLDQIHAYTREENHAAIAVLTRNGFSLAEKTLKEYVTFSYLK